MYSSKSVRSYIYAKIQAKICMFTQQNRRGLNRLILRPLWSTAANVISVPGVYNIIVSAENHFVVLQATTCLMWTFQYNDTVWSVQTPIMKVKWFYEHVISVVGIPLLGLMIFILNRGPTLSHWGLVMHIYISNLTIIGSNNGLSPGWPQAIIWNSAGILLIGPLGTNSSEIFIQIYIFSFKNMI